jgi:hypothetical protein
MSKLLYFFGLLVMVITLSTCKSEYASYVEREMSSGVVNDSLIFGMRMGQTKKDFFEQCWELNRQQLITQGSGNTRAKYIEPADSTKNPKLRKEMQFYGIFDEDNVMQGMDMTYNYVAWSPWLKSTFSDSLVMDLKQSYLQDYGGNDFIEIKIDDVSSSAFVKVDGNRQILIYAVNDKDVRVIIEDLNFKFNQDKKDKKETKSNREI